VTSETEPLPDRDHESAGEESEQTLAGNGEQTNDDDKVDEMSEDSFPTSDPPSTWGGEDNA